MASSYNLLLHHHSSDCYSILQNSGVLVLPSGHTLKDYKHIAPDVIGFSTLPDRQLLHQMKQQKPSHLVQYIGIVVDEMYTHTYTHRHTHRHTHKHIHTHL